MRFRAASIAVLLALVALIGCSESATRDRSVVADLDTGRDGPTVLLRGDMNGWDESTPLAYNGDGTYAVTVALTADPYNFKLASADWSTVNLGATSADTTTVTIGEALDLLQGSQDNLSITIDADGTYLFTIAPVADYSSVRLLVTGP